MRFIPGVVASLFILCAFVLGSSPGPVPSTVQPQDKVVLERVESEEETFRVVQDLQGLEHPWAVAWLPDSRMLITEKAGQMLLVDGESTTTLSGLPEIEARGQGGLLDVRLHPNYDETGWIYFTYTAPGEGGVGTVVSRAHLDGTSLTDVEELYRQQPFAQSGLHFGSRIAFLDDGTMAVSMGERGQRQADGPGAQDSTNTIGTTIRLHLDGSIPDDNPFVDREEIPSAIYSYGHRNQQGMAVHPETGDIWQTEHGPHGGDELNLVTPGTNYGWPAISWGDTYSTPHEPIGGTEAPGMAQPVKYWDPSPALAGMTFYTGDKFPNWQNDLFLGALEHQKILRVELEGHEVAHEEILLQEEIGRIRDVAVGPDGYLYLLTDESDGGLYRLEPVD